MGIELIPSVFLVCAYCVAAVYMFLFTRIDLTQHKEILASLTPLEDAMRFHIEQISTIAPEPVQRASFLERKHFYWLNDACSVLSYNLQQIIGQECTMTGDAISSSLGDSMLLDTDQ